MYVLYTGPSQVVNLSDANLMSCVRILKPFYSLFRCFGLGRIGIRFHRSVNGEEMHFLNKPEKRTYVLRRKHDSIETVASNGIASASESEGPSSNPAGV
jgi:hypothetical protein